MTVSSEYLKLWFLNALTSRLSFLEESRTKCAEVSAGLKLRSYLRAFSNVLHMFDENLSLRFDQKPTYHIYYKTFQKK